jgi:hypothetical protein
VSHDLRLVPTIVSQNMATHDHVIAGGIQPCIGCQADLGLGLLEPLDLLDGHGNGRWVGVDPDRGSRGADMLGQQTQNGMSEAVGFVKQSLRSRRPF